MEIKSKRIIPAIPETEIEEVDYVICDLCKQSKGKFTYTSDSVSWRSDKVSETIISFEHGWNFPEGGETTTETFHICDKCFESKLVPWLQSQSAEPTLEVNDW